MDAPQGHRAVREGAWAGCTLGEAERGITRKSAGNAHRCHATLMRSGRESYNAQMRRAIAVFLMLLFPLQVTWAAVESMHAHIAVEGSEYGFHVHSSDHDHDHEADGSPGLNGQDDNSANGHQDGHYHPVFSMMTTELGPSVTEQLPGDRPFPDPSSFTSRIPPLFDWPPLALI